MNPATGSKPSTASPRLNQGKEGHLRTLVALFGAPTTWMVQLLLSEPLVAHACYPYQTPLAAPLWDGLALLLSSLSLVCLVFALLSGFVAWTSWRQVASQASSGGNPVEMTAGRRRFLAKLGVMSSLIFIVAVIFNICAVLLTPLCSSWF